MYTANFEACLPFGANFFTPIAPTPNAVGNLACVSTLESGMIDDVTLPFVPGVPAIPDFDDPNFAPATEPSPFEEEVPEPSQTPVDPTPDAQPDPSEPLEPPEPIPEDSVDLLPA